MSKNRVRSENYKLLISVHILIDIVFSLETQQRQNIALQMLVVFHKHKLALEIFNFGFQIWTYLRIRNKVWINMVFAF